MNFQAYRDLVEHAKAPRYRGLFRFSTVGAITTLGDFVIFSFLTVAMDVSTIPANLVSYSCGIVASFILNRNWTFGDAKSGGSVSAQGLRFALTNFAGLVISTAIVALLAIFLPRPVAKFLSIPAVFVWNFLTARHWVFR